MSKRYNHMVTVAFTVHSGAQDGSDFTPAMLREAMLTRIKDLDNSPKGQEWLEAVGAPVDTYEEEPEVAEETVPPPQPGRKAKRVALVCPYCGSAAIAADASAHWCVDTQEWELSASYDSKTCDDCGEEFDSAEEVDLNQFPPVGSEEWVELARQAAAKPARERSCDEMYLIHEASEAGFEIEPVWLAAPCPY